MQLINYIKKNIPYKIFYLALLIVILPAIVHFSSSFCKKIGIDSFTKHIYAIDLLFLLSFGIIYKYNLKKNLAQSYVIALITMIVFARLSLIFSDGKNYHRSYYELFKFAAAASLFFVATSEYFKKNKETILKTFLYVILSIALFECLVALFQFIFQKPLGLSFLGEPFFGQDVATSARIYLGSKVFGSNFLIRTHGTFVHPNVFGGFLCITSILSLYVLHNLKKNYQKYLMILFVLLQGFILVTTFSRAAIGATFISMILWFLLMFFKKYNVKKLALIFSLCSIVLVSFFSKPLIERGLLGSSFQSKKAHTGNVASFNVRKDLQNVSIAMVKKKPFFGVGYRNFIKKRDDFASNVERANVHNIYLLIASEMGLLALFCFLGFIILLSIKAFKNLNDITITFFSIIIGILLIGIADHYFMSEQFGRIMFFSMFSFIYLFSNQESLEKKKVLLCQ